MVLRDRSVAVIPARGGSKAVPLKNLKMLGGKPLIGWTIETALATPEIDRVIVSTDHDGIAACAKQFGAEVLRRPDHLATDSALTVDTLRYHISELRRMGEDARFVVLLQPTSPFRLVQHVSECVNVLARNKLDSIATFVEADLHPHRAWSIGEGGVTNFIPNVVPWLPRQELPPAFQLNGAVYAFVADRLPVDQPGVLFGKVGAVMMDRITSIDIDDELDFLFAETILSAGVLEDK